MVPAPRSGVIRSRACKSAGSLLPPALASRESREDRSARALTSAATELFVTPHFPKSLPASAPREPPRLYPSLRPVAHARGEMSRGSRCRQAAVGLRRKGAAECVYRHVDRSRESRRAGVRRRTRVTRSRERRAIEAGGLPRAGHVAMGAVSSVCRRLRHGLETHLERRSRTRRGHGPAKHRRTRHGAACGSGRARNEGRADEALRGKSFPRNRQRDGRPHGGRARSPAAMGCAAARGIPRLGAARRHRAPFAGCRRRGGAVHGRLFTAERHRQC